jgi:tetratricopeptide (TPR) repeat protein
MNHLERAVALRSAGQLADSIAAFQLAIKEDPLNPEVWYQTAMAAMDYRDYRYAAAMLGSYVRFQPGRAGPFFDLAYCQMRIADYEGAVRSLERTIALRPDHPRAQVALGQILYGLGQPDAAYAAHSAALETRSERPADRAVCGIIHLLRGDYLRGWTAFE